MNVGQEHEDDKEIGELLRKLVLGVHANKNAPEVIGRPSGQSVHLLQVVLIT